MNITALKSMVTAVTSIGTSSFKSKGSNNSFEINYVIKIPKNGSVKLLNKYGNIATETIYGATDIACRYGKISLGKLNNTSNNVKIEYCQSSAIDYIKSGNITARYSGLKINESGNLNLDTNYTDLVILEGKTLNTIVITGLLNFRK